MKRHILDTDESLLRLTEIVAKGFIEEFLHGRLDLRECFNKLKSEAQRLDEIASKKYRDNDLVEYRARVKFGIIPQLELLEKNVHLYERSKDLCYVKSAIPRIAFLRVELRGLGYTIEECVEEAFYGYVTRSYFLKGNNLSGLYDRICEDLSIRSYREGKGMHGSDDLHIRVFSEDEGELRVTVHHGDKSGSHFEGIHIDLLSFVGGAYLSDNARSLVNFVEDIARTNGFKFKIDDKNKF